MKVFTGNCWYSLYSMLKGTLLSYNSGYQVSKRRRWDCASFSLGLLNWLCYCRPVQGEGSERESRIWYITHRAFNCDPSPRVFTAALSGEGDLALHPSLYFSQWTAPHPSCPTPLVPFLSEVIFYTIMDFLPPLSFSLRPSVRLSRESLILSALWISTLFQRGMPASFQWRILASPPLPTHTCI